MPSKYIYTQNKNNVLSKQQRQFYDDNGFLLIRNNVNHQHIDEICQRFVDICDGKTDSSAVLTIMKDQTLIKAGAKGQYLINKIQDWLHDDILFKYAANQNVTAIIESIIGSDITAIHSMLINKPPDADPNFSLHPLHQDLHYFPIRPANLIAASWTAMEKVNEQNGCLFVVPGSHKGTLLRHKYPKDSKNKLYHGIYGLDHLSRINVEMQKGDTVFFHPLLLHGSGPNLTKGFRKAISCHYANSNCHYINVKNTVQEEIAVEVEEMLKRRGATIPYHEGWRIKSRVVQGQDGRLQTLDSHL